MSKLTITELQARLDLITVAQEMLHEAVGLVRDAIDDLECEGWADAYVLAPLVILANPNHGYLTRDSGLHDVAEAIQNEIDEAREREWAELEAQTA